MSRMIDADRLKAYWQPDHDRMFVADYFIHTIDAQPTVDAIPTAWIREQMCEYPGMESAMWSKLLRLWKREGRQ